VNSDIQISKPVPRKHQIMWTWTFSCLSQAGRSCINLLPLQ